MWPFNMASLLLLILTLVNGQGILFPGDERLATTQRPRNNQAVETLVVTSAQNQLNILKTLTADYEEQNR